MQPSSAIVAAQTADNGYQFVSYSRQQFYFAESLALQLQDAGVSVWFDTQQLSPGEDWAQGIEAGLAGCRGVVLLASRAALASDYVAREWQAALASEKPVYVALFEAVCLPPELTPAAVIDLRTHFDRGTARLAAAIDGQERHVDRVPRPNRWGIPTRLPLSLTLIVLTLSLTGLFIALPVLWNLVSVAQTGLEGFVFRQLWEISGQANPYTAAFMNWANRGLFSIFIIAHLLFLAAGGYYLLSAWRFLQRRFNYRLTYLALLGVLAMPYFASLFGLFSTFGKLLQDIPLDSTATGAPVVLTPASEAPESVGPTATTPPATPRSAGAETAPAPQATLPSAEGLGGVLLGGLLGLGACGLCFLAWAPLWWWLGSLIVYGRSRSVYRWLPTGEAPDGRRLRYGRRHGVTLSSRDLAQQGRPIGYRLRYAPADSGVGDKLRTAMDRAGHTEIQVGAPDAQDIAILSNKTPITLLRDAVEETTNLVSVLATGVDVGGAVPDAASYQWVDYRRQRKDQLRELAQYLRHPGIGADAYGLSVLTENLSKHVVPRPISLLALALRLWAIYTLVASVQPLLLESGLLATPLPVISGRARALTIAVHLLAIAVSILFVWIANGVVQRQITHRVYARWVIPTGLFNWLVPFLFSGATLALFDFYRLAGLAIVLVTLPAVANWLPRPTPAEQSEPTLAASSRLNLWRRAARDLAILMVPSMVGIVVLLPRWASTSPDGRLFFGVPPTWFTATVTDGDLNAALEGVGIRQRQEQIGIPLNTLDSDTGPFDAYTTPFPIADVDVLDAFGYIAGYHKEVASPVWIGLDSVSSLFVIVVRGEDGGVAFPNSDPIAYLPSAVQAIRVQESDFGVVETSEVTDRQPLSIPGAQAELGQLATTYTPGGDYIMRRHWLVAIDAERTDYLVHLVEIQAAPVTAEAMYEGLDAALGESFPWFGALLEAQRDAASTVQFDATPVVRRFISSLKVESPRGNR